MHVIFNLIRSDDFAESGTCYVTSILTNCCFQEYYSVYPKTVDYCKQEQLPAILHIKVYVEQTRCFIKTRDNEQQHYHHSSQY